MNIYFTFKTKQKNIIFFFEQIIAVSEISYRAPRSKINIPYCLYLVGYFIVLIHIIFKKAYASLSLFQFSFALYYSHLYLYVINKFCFISKIEDSFLLFIDFFLDF